MAGERLEWVSGEWPRLHVAGEVIDPDPASGTLRIVRGAWVNDDVSMLRCAYRQLPPDTTHTV
jgi:hypothetical protein